MQQTHLTAISGIVIASLTDRTQANRLCAADCHQDRLGNTGQGQSAFACRQRGSLVNAGQRRSGNDAAIRGLPTRVQDRRYRLQILHVRQPDNRRPGVKDLE